ENGRDEVVGERRIADHASVGPDLLHHGQTESLRRTALDLPDDRLRVERLADVLYAVERDHLDQAEFGVDVDDRAVGGEAVLHMGIALAGLRVERLCRTMAPLDRLVEFAVP